MLNVGFKVELLRFVVGLCLFALVGSAFGYTLAFASAVLFVYVLRLFFLIYQLDHWIDRTRRLDAPAKSELKGLWFELGYNIEIIFSRHKKQKRRLKKVVKRFRKMGLALSDGVILLDNHENIEWWNRAAGRLIDLKKQDTGYRITNYVRNPEFVQYFDAGEYEIPLALALKENTLHLEITIYPFGKKEKLVFVRDATRLHKLELMRRDFVANVSHELRTPLTVIRGYVETFSDFDIPPAWDKAFIQMQQQCIRMDDLISDLILLSNLEINERSPEQRLVNIAALLYELIDDLGALSRDREIVVTCDESIDVLGSENELRSALSNLIVNAINYSDSKEQIVVNCSCTADEVVIRVIDFGIGIDPEHISRLTERFYRVDPSRTVTTGGTGLGLAIVKHVLIRHNGELKVSSRLGEGSVFSCHLPRPESI